MNKKKVHQLKQVKIIEVPRFKEEAGFYATTKSSVVMSKIRSENTKAEILLRKALWRRGFRYRLHAKRIIGKPDIIFGKHKLAVFIDGDFWHGFNWEEKKKKLISNKTYWIPKIERNMQRDIEVNQILHDSGWFVVRFWEHEIWKQLDACIEKIIYSLQTIEKNVVFRK